MEYWFNYEDSEEEDWHRNNYEYTEDENCTYGEDDCMTQQEQEVDSLCADVSRLTMQRQASNCSYGNRSASRGTTATRHPTATGARAHQRHWAEPPALGKRGNNVQWKKCRPSRPSAFPPNFPLCVDIQLLPHCVQETNPKIVRAVTGLVQKTWTPDLVGRGRDAVGLDGYSSVMVRNVYRVVNRDVKRRYNSCVRKLMQNSTNMSRPNYVQTRNQPGCEVLDAMLRREVNEYLLFHGTRETSIELITKDGFKVSDNEGLFGSGCYFAESSTKSDQYTDERTDRKLCGQPLYMILTRVAMGNVYFKTKKTAGRMHSVETLYSRGYDSIVGTHRPADRGRLLFREFMVFDEDQACPQYIIEYERHNVL